MQISQKSNTTQKLNLRFPILMVVYPYYKNMDQTFLNQDFILVDKPVGWTSFDAVNFVRGKLRIATGNKKIKVGHAGTLDPFATGLLIIAAGRENTKRIDEFKAMPKTYVATIRLGATSDTFDCTGVITPTKVLIEKTDSRLHGNDSKNYIKNIIKTFIGIQPQLPPMYSAKKINGQCLYDLARKGITIERQPNEITIFDIKLLDYTYPNLSIEVICSTGTYIRTLAYDIGNKLEVGAYCQELRRTSIGQYNVADAQKIEK